MWVLGEVQRVRTASRGHLYFELVEKGQGDQIVGKIDSVLWHTDHLRVARTLRAEGLRIADGQQIRCRGKIDYYGPAGRLQLVVREVDPLFALGQLERRRRANLAYLRSAGLLERNQGLQLAKIPLRLILVTSAGSAAYHDFLAGLAASGFGFRVKVMPCAMQGVRAQPELVRCFERIVELASCGERFDAVVLVRGGGARSDLAAFDSRAVAEAVARCALPVLTGLGHEIDRAVADHAAYRAFKTPSDVGTFLAERIAQCEADLSEIALRLAHLARVGLVTAHHRLSRACATARLAHGRVRAAAAGTEDLALRLEHAARHRLSLGTATLERASERMASSAQAAIARRRPRIGHAMTRILDRVHARLAVVGARVEGHRRVCTALAPTRMLRRGFSITRDAGGRVIRHPAAVSTGNRLLTEVAGGRIESRVVAPQRQPQPRESEP